MLLRRRHPLDPPITAMGYLALVALLSGCASETAWRTPITSASPVTTDNTTECSLIGRLACRSMAFISNDGSSSQQGTCTASRAGGTYIETCGTAAASATVAAPVAPPPPKPQVAPAQAGTASRSSLQLSWKDNSNNETGFVIERCDQILRDVRSAKMTATCRGGGQQDQAR
jgi:hypothetical protein